MKNQHHIYWWNLENLFDIEDSPRRPDWLQKELKRELKGWNNEVLGKKIEALASIITQFQDGKGPDILGICEVENEYVINLLMTAMEKKLGRKYATLHHDTDDGRGIDIAFIYCPEKYKPMGKLFSLTVLKRNATRDLLQAQFETKAGNQLILIGNHWPSRIGGEYETEPYRIMVAETLSYWLKRIPWYMEKEYGIKEPSVILMGDFNDNPTDRSITDYLRATPHKTRVSKAKTPVYLNLMTSMMGNELGTQVSGSQLNHFDQFMISRAIATSSKSHPFQLEDCSIVSFPGMTKGAYNTPIRFSRPSKTKKWGKGFSDHLPVKLVLGEQ